jgi:hypothetical protein
VVDTVVCLIDKIKQTWGKGKLGAYLFIDIIGAFNHIIRQKLIGGLWGIGIDRDLIR